MVWTWVESEVHPDKHHLLLLLYGYYQSRFGLIPRSRGGRWGLIKATVCSNILQMFLQGKVEGRGKYHEEGQQYSGWMM